MAGLLLDEKYGFGEQIVRQVFEQLIDFFDYCHCFGNKLTIKSLNINDIKMDLNGSIKI